MESVTDLFSQPLAWLLLTAYFFPTILAILGRSSGWAACFWVNLFFGWTFIGWVICLILANGPTNAQLAIRDQITLACNEFYLREQDKANRS